MKYIKKYEAVEKRKFKEGDIVRYKNSQSQPFKITGWNKILNSYEATDMVYNKSIFVVSHSMEIYPPEELEQFYIKKDAEKYNL